MRLNPPDALLYLSMRIMKALDRRRTGIKNLRPDSVRNILLVSSTAIGDTLFSTPAIRAVRKRYPGARITALLNKNNMGLFENNPNLDGIVPYHGGYKRFFRTIRRLRALKPDLAIILHGNEPQATPMCYLSGAPFIIKVPNANQYNFLLSNGSILMPLNDTEHAIEARLKAASLAGCGVDDKHMELFIDKAGEEEVRGLLHKNGVRPDDVLIGFQPGASTISRMWFPDRFAELGRRLKKDLPGSKIVVTGSPDEAALCEKIASEIGPGALSVAGRLGLKALPALMKRLDLLVTGDTGPMQVAVALDTPVVALFAAAEPKGTGPYPASPIHRVIQKRRTCEPCVSKRCRYQKCMEEIGVDEVHSAVASLLRTSRGLKFSAINDGEF